MPIRSVYQFIVPGWHYLFFVGAISIVLSCKKEERPEKQSAYFTIEYEWGTANREFISVGENKNVVLSREEFPLNGFSDSTLIRFSSKFQMGIGFHGGLFYEYFGIDLFKKIALADTEVDSISNCRRLKGAAFDGIFSPGEWEYLEKDCPDSIGSAGVVLHGFFALRSNCSTTTTLNCQMPDSIMLDQTSSFFRIIESTPYVHPELGEGLLLDGAFAAQWIVCDTIGNAKDGTFRIFIQECPE